LPFLARQHREGLLTDRADYAKCFFRAGPLRSCAKVQFFYRVIGNEFATLRARYRARWIRRPKEAKAEEAEAHSDQAAQATA